MACLHVAYEVTVTTQNFDFEWDFVQAGMFHSVLLGDGQITEISYDF